LKDMPACGEKIPNWALALIRGSNDELISLQIRALAKL
jgi:hypothetical protein